MPLESSIETMLADRVARIGEDLAAAFPIEIDLEAASGQVVDCDRFLRTVGPAFYCGRSLFVAEGRGIGGWIVPEHAADRLARSALDLPPPPPHAVTTIGGPANQGAQILFELFLTGWNRETSPEWRLSEETTGRVVERFCAESGLPARAGVHSKVLAVTLRIGGQASQVGILLSPKMFGGENPLEAVPTRVVPCTRTDRNPIAFADPSGEFVRWLEEQVRAGVLECYRPRAEDLRGGPVATLVVGTRPGVGPVETLAIRPR